MKTIILLFLFTINSSAQSRSEQVKMMRVPVSKYKENDTVKNLVLLKWVKRGKNHFWKCNDGKLYSELLIDDLKNKNKQ